MRYEERIVFLLTCLIVFFGHPDHWVPNKKKIVLNFGRSHNISVRSGSFLNTAYPRLLYNYEYRYNCIGHLLLLKLTTNMIQKTKSWWNQGWLFECSQMWHWMTNIAKRNCATMILSFSALERGGGRLPARMSAMSPSSTLGWALGFG